MGGFSLHGNEQNLALHGDIGLCRISGRVGVIVSFVPVALLDGSDATGSGAGGRTAVESERTGEDGSSLNNTIRVPITKDFLSSCTAALNRKNLWHIFDKAVSIFQIENFLNYSRIGILHGIKSTGMSC